VAGKTLSIGLLADFNVQNLAVLLQKGSTAPSCICASFGQTVNLLLNPKAGFWSSPYDAVVLWTAPEHAVPSFNKVVASEQSSPEDLVKDVDAFAGLLQHIPDTVQTILLPSWMRMQPGWEPLDLRNGVGVANALMRMNLRLAEVLEHDRRIVVLDSHRWINAAGATAYDPRLWYLSKTPFHTKVFEEASRDILAVLEGFHGKSKKVVILDLDNTLWGGVVGEVGWDKLRLGGHDPVGEAFVDFQKALKRLSHRGIILALVSKNDESVALEAIERHPEMVLKVNDFAGWKINWLDKAGNIVQLMAELNLGLESAVFLDDSPFECARVREALPQVLVPDLPPDPMRYPLFLTGLRCFENPFVSLEDRNRTKMYVADRGRTELRKDVSSLQEWLAMLELEVKVELLNHSNLERAAQLFNKTNQMNLSTRRLSAAELLSWSRGDGHILWTFRVRDKFGDYGLCGIGSLVRNGASGQIVDFLISCRVMGRGVEEAMLATVLQSAKALGCDTVHAQFISTPRNEPCRKWLENLPAVKINAGKVMFSSIEAIPAPIHVSINFSETDDEVLVQTRQ